jgi:hypothetical protein
VDNDQNGDTDVNDGACAVCGDSICTVGEACSSDCGDEDYCADGADNDQDGDIDNGDLTCAVCGDSVCATGEECSADCSLEVHCTDGADNDQDGQSDILDSDCSVCGDSICSLEEVCNIDCSEETHCSDSADNDQDADTDGDDADCVAPDSTPPSLVSANGEGKLITLTFNETLDTSIPAPSSMTISINGVDVAPEVILVNREQVRLSLQQPLSPGSTVRVTYTQPGSNPRLQDTANNLIGTLANIAVITPAAAGGGGGGGGGSGGGTSGSTGSDAPRANTSSSVSSADTTQTQNRNNDSLPNPQTSDLLVIQERPAAPALPGSFAAARQALLDQQCTELLAPQGARWFQTAFDALGINPAPAGRVFATDALQLMASIGWNVTGLAERLNLLPRQPLSRGQAIRILSLTLQLVDDEASERDAATAAIEACILRGYPDASLRLSQPVTWAEFATIIHRALSL